MKQNTCIMILTVLLAGCYYDNKEDLYPNPGICDTTTVTYSGKVFDIIQSACYSCHGSGNMLGNVNLDGYTNLKIYADNGKLIGVTEHQAGYSPMPQGGKLGDCDINVLKMWVREGTPNN